MALTPNKAARAPFATPPGTVGSICRDNSFANNLIMRHVSDRMVVAPPLVISRDEVDMLIERAWTAFDQTHEKLKSEGMMRAA